MSTSSSLTHGSPCVILESLPVPGMEHLVLIVSGNTVIAL